MGSNKQTGWLGVMAEDERTAVYDTVAEAKEKFGENYGGFVVPLTRAQVDALLQGQVVAFDIGGREYAGFLTLRAEPGADA